MSCFRAGGRKSFYMRKSGVLACRNHIGHKIIYVIIKILLSESSVIYHCVEKVYEILVRRACNAVIKSESSRSVSRNAVFDCFAVIINSAFQGIRFGVDNVRHFLCRNFIFICRDVLFIALRVYGQILPVVALFDDYSRSACGKGLSVFKSSFLFSNFRLPENHSVIVRRSVGNVYSVVISAEINVNVIVERKVG